VAFRGVRLAPERPLELVGWPPHAAEQLPDVRDSRSQLRIADFRRQQRILQRGQSAICLGSRVDRAVDEPLRAGRGNARRGCLACAARQPVAVCKLRMRPFRPTVGDLNRPEKRHEDGRNKDPAQRPRDKRGERPGRRARPASTALTRGYGRPEAGICPPLREGSEMYIGIGTLVAILIIVLLVILIF
jgi:hypothetical protein